MKKKTKILIECPLNLGYSKLRISKNIDTGKLSFYMWVDEKSKNSELYSKRLTNEKAKKIFISHCFDKWTIGKKVFLKNDIIKDYFELNK